jgi:hypothetical protein
MQASLPPATFLIQLSRSVTANALATPQAFTGIPRTQEWFMATSIGEVLGILTIGQPIKYGALGIYPLKADRVAPLIHYLVLDEAIKTGAFRITEVSESGTVPQLRAINETPSLVFLLDGEQLISAKQNRVLNLSLMLAAKSESEIPVACVVRSAPQERATTVSLGETVRLSTDEVVGAALEVNGSCVHLAAFRRDGVLGGARARR